MAQMVHCAVLVYHRALLDRTRFISLGVLPQDGALRRTVVLLLFLQLHEC